MFRDYINSRDKDWFDGKVPNYSKVDKAYLKGRKTILKADSLELAVTKAVKNCEVEIHHILNKKQWNALVQDKLKTTPSDFTSPAELLA